MGSVEQVGFREQVEQLEAFIAGQRPVESEHYDDQYFQGEWREGGNCYHIETRRKIEAKNPENIKEVFQPGSVLDVGCGPGALMLFLQELGIEVQGIDFSAAAKQMAPDGVREKIVTGRLSKFYAGCVLSDQPWIHDDKKSVQKALEGELGKGSKIDSFVLVRLG